MNKFRNFYLSLAVCFVFSVFNVYGFDGPTHKYVTEESLSILHRLDLEKQDDRIQEDCNLGTDNSEDADDDFYNDKIKVILLEYCVKPDEDEIDGGFKWHFYNPATERNFMGEKESALTKFIDHYNRAVANYKAGYIIQAFQELGRALHFVEDLSTPVHTNYENFIDAGIKLSMHVEFEKRCVAVQDMCKADVRKENLKYYLKNTKKIIGKSCAYLSADLFYSLENKLSSQDTIAKHSILNAQRVVVGLLNRFRFEVTTNPEDDFNMITVNNYLSK